jgi:hypothetical protein
MNERIAYLAFGPFRRPVAPNCGIAIVPNLQSGNGARGVAQNLLPIRAHKTDGKRADQEEHEWDWKRQSRGDKDRAGMCKHQRPCQKPRDFYIYLQFIIKLS